MRSSFYLLFAICTILLGACDLRTDREKYSADEGENQVGAPTVDQRSGDDGPPADLVISTATEELNGRGSDLFGGMECTDYFAVSDVRVDDQQRSGNSARVMVSYSVWPQDDLGSGAMANDYCYGAPAEGWQVGQPARSRTTYIFELWESGWRYSRKE